MTICFKRGRAWATSFVGYTQETEPRSPSHLEVVDHFGMWNLSISYFLLVILIGGSVTFCASEIHSIISKTIISTTL